MEVPSRNSKSVNIGKDNDKDKFGEINKSVVSGYFTKKVNCL